MTTPTIDALIAENRRLVASIRAMREASERERAEREQHKVTQQASK